MNAKYLTRWILTLLPVLVTKKARAPRPQRPASIGCG
jgi:hypothetical protein